jgi:hypothetical protein
MEATSYFPASTTDISSYCALTNLYSQFQSGKLYYGVGSRRHMNPMTIVRTMLLVVALATCAVGADKTQTSYQKGTIKGWDKQTDMWGYGGNQPIPRDKTVFELKGSDLTYLIDYCGAFQAGQFDLGQPVDYRVDDQRQGATTARNISAR